MSEQPEHPSLQEVLDAYVSEARGPNSTELAEWCRRYPEYAEQLTEFAAAWSLTKWLPPADAAAVDEAGLARHGRAAVEKLLRARRAGGAAWLPPAANAAAVDEAALVQLPGLAAEARRRGLSLQQLAEQSELSVVLVRKLDQRLIRFATVPRRAVEALAAALGRDVAAIAAYLQQPPTLARAARYRAARAPELAEQEDFDAAVRADPTLSPERRAAWLSERAGG